MESGSAAKDGKTSKPVHPSRKRGRNACLAVLAVVLLAALILLILGLTVFKAKRATTTVDSVSVKDLDVSFDVVRLRVRLNVSLNVNLSVKNPNKVGFKYSDSKAVLRYRGEEVGEAPIAAGRIPADQTVPFNLTLTILADRLLSNSNTYSDVLSDSLPLSTYSRLSGKVRIFNLFNIHVVSTTSCDLTVKIRNASVTSQNCNYKTKL